MEVVWDWYRDGKEYNLSVANFSVGTFGRAKVVWRWVRAARLYLSESGACAHARLPFMSLSQWPPLHTSSSCLIIIIIFIPRFYDMHIYSMTTFTFHLIKMIHLCLIAGITQFRYFYSTLNEIFHIMKSS